MDWSSAKTCGHRQRPEVSIYLRVQLRLAFIPSLQGISLMALYLLNTSYHTSSPYA
ncbi:hypothetical protein M433DRAFT_158038 [Acidomyces richmondensis BFW]|nr:MAG: hypothetical protein FE78DRAFT_84327 [Acidomyces sp. 'richmondensis']KYG42304.1 hypothetical protein M433DRAFT_158038 [Acidomyces richmondensis BFW]